MHSSIESARQQHLIHQITLCNMEPTIIYVQITLWNIEPTFTSEDYIVGHRAHDVITADYMKPTDICKNDIAGHETDDHITISISAPQWPSINGITIDQCIRSKHFEMSMMHQVSVRLSTFNEYENGRHSWRNHLDCLLCAWLCAEIPPPTLQKSCKHIWGVTYVYDSQESDIA